jgi:hypothetical protein
VLAVLSQASGIHLTQMERDSEQRERREQSEQVEQDVLRACKRHASIANTITPETPATATRSARLAGSRADSFVVSCPRHRHLCLFIGKEQIAA